MHIACCHLGYELHLISCHDIRLYMGVLAVGRSGVPMQEGSLAADCGPHQLHLALQAGGQDAAPVHKALQEAWRFRSRSTASRLAGAFVRVLLHCTALSKQLSGSG